MAKLSAQVAVAALIIVCAIVLLAPVKAFASRCLDELRQVEPPV